MSAIEIPHDVQPHPITGMYNGKFGLWLFLASEVMLFGALFSTYVLLRVGAPDDGPLKWPHHTESGLNVPLATVNTAVLITSSVTVVMAWYFLQLRKFSAARLCIAATLLLACTFLVIKYFEYSAKFHHYVLTEPGGAQVHGHVTEWTQDTIVFQPDAGHGHGGGAEHAQPMRLSAEAVRQGKVRFGNLGPWHSNFYATYFTMTGLHGLHVLGGVVAFLFLLGPGARMWKTNPEKYTNRVECTGLYWHFVDLVWIFLFPSLYLL